MTDDFGPLETQEAADAALRLIAARRGDEAYRDELMRAAAEMRAATDDPEELVWEYLRLIHALTRAASTALMLAAQGELYDEMEVLKFIEAALTLDDDADEDDE